MSAAKIGGTILLVIQSSEQNAVMIAPYKWVRPEER